MVESLVRTVSCLTTGAGRSLTRFTIVKLSSFNKWARSLGGSFVIAAPPWESKFAARQAASNTERIAATASYLNSMLKRPPGPLYVSDRSLSFSFALSIEKYSRPSTDSFGLVS